MKKILMTIFATAAMVFAASAQEAGDWTIAPKVNLYMHTGTDLVFGVGTGMRYSITDDFRIEPSAIFMIDKNSSMEFSCDLHYIFTLVDNAWNIYPLVGLVANNITGWSSGVNVGAGFDFVLSRDWDLTVQAKWQPMFSEFRKNAVALTLGASYRF